MKSFGFCCLFMLGFALLETAVLSNIVILPAVPDIILLCSLYFSLQNGKLYGVSGGFVSGLLMDFFSAVPFGFNCLLRTIFGYISGVFNKSLNINGVFFPVLLGICATVIKVFIIRLISLFYPNVIINYQIFSAAFGFELLLNGIFCPLVFRFLDVFKNTLLLNPEKVS